MGCKALKASVVSYRLPLGKSKISEHDSGLRRSLRFVQKDVIRLDVPMYQRYPSSHSWRSMAGVTYAILTIRDSIDQAYKYMPHFLFFEKSANLSFVIYSIAQAPHVTELHVKASAGCSRIRIVEGVDVGGDVGMI